MEKNGAKLFSFQEEESVPLLPPPSPLPAQYLPAPDNRWPNNTTDQKIYEIYIFLEYNQTKCKT